MRKSYQTWGNRITKIRYIAHSTLMLCKIILLAVNVYVVTIFFEITCIIICITDYTRGYFNYF